jgi:hypothetical protein
MDVIKTRSAAQATQGAQTPTSVIERYYDLIVSSVADFEFDHCSDAFEPAMKLPPLDARMQSFLSVADFQGCEPFLSKGTFQYKKRFGARAVIPDNAFGQWRLLIRTPTLCPSTRQFLVNNPLIGLDAEGQLQAQYFFDANHEIRSDIPFASKGIHSQVSHNLDEWNN